MEPLVTVREAATRLALKESTIRRMIFERRIPVVHLGRSVRIKVEDIDAMIRRGYRPALPDTYALWR